MLQASISKMNVYNFSSASIISYRLRKLAR